MNKKQTNILLGIAVVVIWGSAAYRVIKGLNDTDEPVPEKPVVQKAAVNDYASGPDTTRLSLHYRDPFGPAHSKETKDTVIRRSKKTDIAVKPVSADLSFIKYAGFITNPGTGKTVVMLMINGRTAMLKEGESAGDLKLLKNLRDAVKIYYRKQIYYIAKPSA